MEQKARQPLTKDRIIGMQVVGPDAYFVGKVKDISLCVGEMDQALVIELNDGEEEVHRWSEVAGAGDVILLKAAPPQPTAQATAPETVTPPATPPPNAATVYCGGCGAALSSGTKFCGSCGKQAA